MSEMAGKSCFVRDKKGRVHYVIYQTYGTTCGPACAAMLEYYYKNKICRKDAEDKIKELVGWSEGSGVGRGTLAENIERKLGIPCKLLVVDSTKQLFETLKTYVGEKTPAIVELDHSWQTMGHYALCRFVDDDGIGIFLDPESGLKEVGKNSLPFFRFNSAGKLNFSGGRYC